MPFNSPSPRPATDRERACALVQLAFWGSAPSGNRTAEWLLNQLRRSPNLALHMNDVLRECPWGPAQAEAAIEALLDYGLSEILLTWRRDEDGVLVYDGCEPGLPRLPIGQDPFRPGFRWDDWMHNARPATPVRAVSA